MFISWYNPGIRVPEKKLPQEVLIELSSFTESESVDREARIEEIAAIFNIQVSTVLKQLEKIQQH
jgi:hypothetical protein